MAPYWNPDLLDLNDSLNREIWERSPGVQSTEIGMPKQYGAQQAMTDTDEVLSWPPDMVGKSCSTSAGLLVCGSAYAGFISPFSDRNGHSVTLKEYHQPTAAAFQPIFVDNVVRDADRHYGVIENLLKGIRPLDQTVLFDLCRASFVEKGRRDGVSFDKSGDKVVVAKEARSIFEKYVECPTPASWLWGRLSGGFGRHILALGSIAEHGLLRLFARRGMELYIGDVGPIQFDPEDARCASGEWVRYYGADLMLIRAKRPRHWFRRRVTLKFWLDDGTWWTIRNPKDPDDCWLLLPAFHPTSQSTTTIESTRTVLRRMLNCSCKPV
jgi:hypothetical protein